jgi:SAM-dependent methyltransferase
MVQNLTHSQSIETCLISGLPVVQALDLGQHAYADTFVKPEQLNLSEPVFPLQLRINSESGSVQLGYVSHAQDRYNLYNYSYTSSNSQFARDHWDDYSVKIKQRLPKINFVVEIGCNDGYLLNQFRGPGVRTIGIDSSKEMCDLSRELGLEVMPVLFSASVARDMVIRHGKVDLVIANNVFNHANDPVDFARGVSELLAPNGKFVFELPYWLSTIQRGTLPDQVYHEHVSYFTVKSASSLLIKAGLVIEQVEIVNYHGGSLRVVACHSNGEAVPAVVIHHIQEETRKGLFDLDFYHDLQQRLQKQRDTWLRDFYNIRMTNPDAVFIGVGAAAKANTWLTWHGLNATHLHCVTDSSPHKQGKYTPLSRIPILNDQEIAKFANPYALILSWNISEPLKQTLISINPNIRFISQ